ncbi:MAG TPA: glycosyltransferase family 1 protein [Nitrolancea sp.]|nr:glycosyltransferase family 1 protein [Nitrolancea sp.]
MTRSAAKVAIDARLLAQRRGGIARYVDALLRWLPRVAPDLELAAVVNRPSVDSSVPEICVRTPPHFRFERISLGAELGLRRIRLIHSPDFIAPATIQARRVITVHDLAFLRYPAFLERDALRYYIQLERSLCVADRVIAVSAYTASQLIELTRVSRDKITIIPNGTDAVSFEMTREEAKAILLRELGPKIAERVNADRPVILAVGTIEPRKRHELLIEAVAKLGTSDRGLQPTLILVGQTGWACDTIVARIERAERDGSVIWLREVNDDVLSALYQSVTVLAIPSIDEGFGLPMLEAMSSGLAVVAARRGALPEVAGDAAILLDSDEPDAWAEALRQLISDSALRGSLAELGRKRGNELTWERSAELTATVYREVLGR